MRAAVLQRSSDAEKHSSQVEAVKAEASEARGACVGPAILHKLHVKLQVLLHELLASCFLTELQTCGSEC